MNRTVKGDLLSLFQAGHFDVIVQGCNCQGTMGAGLAKQIAHAYPEVAKADRLLFRLAKIQPGSMLPVLTDHGLVVNLYTQFNPGPNAKIEYVIHSLHEMKKWLISINIGEKFVIGIPQVGCGIGGLDWLDVKPQIEDAFHQHDLVFVDYEPQKIVKPPFLGPINVQGTGADAVKKFWDQQGESSRIAATITGPVEFDPEEQWEVDDLHARQIISTEEADKLARDLRGGV